MADLEKAKQALREAGGKVRDEPRPSKWPRKGGVTVTSDPECLAAVRAFVEAFVAPVGEKEAHLFVQAVDEVLTNIIEHGYEMEPGHPIEIELQLQPAGAVVYIRDRAPEFDAGVPSEMNMEGYVKTGNMRGLGLFMIHKMMDQVLHRRRAGGGNETILVKKFG